jgi:hypothetical protein
MTILLGVIACGEGAQAYLKRQYMTIGIVGVVSSSVLAYFLGMGRHRLPDRRGAVGPRRLHRHERLGPGQCPHGAGGDAVAGPAASISPSSRAPSPACWWPASRCSASPSIYFFLTLVIGGFAVNDRVVIDSARGARLRRFADLDLRPSRRRHLHQGRRRRRRLVGKVEAGIPEDDPAQPRHHRRQCRRQRRRLRRHGGRPVRDLCGDGRRHHGAGGDLLSPGARHHDALPAGDRRRLHPHLDHRHLLRQARRQPVDHGRAVQGPDRTGVLSSWRCCRCPTLLRRFRNLGGGRAQLHRLQPVLCGSSASR